MLIDILYPFYAQTLLSAYLAIMNYSSLVSVSNYIANWNLYMVVTEAILSYVTTCEGERANLLDIKQPDLEQGFLALVTLIVRLDNSLFGKLCCAL